MRPIFIMVAWLWNCFVYSCKTIQFYDGISTGIQTIKNNRTVLCQLVYASDFHNGSHGCGVCMYFCGKDIVPLLYKIGFNLNSIDTNESDGFVSTGIHVRFLEESSCCC